MAAAAVVSFASDTIIDAQFVDYLIVFIYFAFVLTIGAARPKAGVGLHRLLPVRTVTAGVGDRAGVHLRQPRRRRDHGHVGVRCGVRAADRALLLGRRDPGDAVPRRRDDAVLLRLEGALGAGVHAAPVRHRRAPGERDLVRGRAAADRRHQPVPARHHHPGAARVAAVGGAGRRRGRRPLLHHPRRAPCRHLQRGPAVLRHRGRTAPAHPDRAAPGRGLGRSHRQDHRRREQEPGGPPRRRSS